MGAVAGNGLRAKTPRRRESTSLCASAAVRATFHHPCRLFRFHGFHTTPPHGVIISGVDP